MLRFLNSLLLNSDGSGALGICVLSVLSFSFSYSFRQKLCIWGLCPALEILDIFRNSAERPRGDTAVVDARLPQAEADFGSGSRCCDVGSCARLQEQSGNSSRGVWYISLIRLLFGLGSGQGFKRSVALVVKTCTALSPELHEMRCLFDSCC